MIATGGVLKEGHAGQIYPRTAGFSESEAEKCRKACKYRSAGDLFEKAAEAYICEGLKEHAVRAYEEAAQMYLKANLGHEARKTQAMADYLRAASYI